MKPNALPKSLIDNPTLGLWVGFETPGQVRVATGKVEIGQGVLTALAQIAADELDVDLSQVRIVSGDTRRCPSEGFTSGSNSIFVAGSAIRLVCAEVRHLFISRLAEELACPYEEISIESGRFFRWQSDTGRDYWCLASLVDLERAATGSAPTKRPAQYRFVGQKIRREDLIDKLSGPAFIHDVAPERCLHARVLHRPWKGARLLGLDETAVQRVAAGPLTTVRDGDLVAFLSEDETVVERAHAAASERARWEEGEAIPEGCDRPAWLMSQPSQDRIVEQGSPAPTRGARTVTALYSRPYIVHGSIAPSCAVAEYSGGDLTVLTHSQGVFALREWLARVLALDVARVTVVHRHGAGCYGHNSADDAAFEAAFLAMHAPDRPVRIQWTREDEFAAGPVGASMAVRLQAVLDGSWRPVDWTTEIWSPVHGRRPGMHGTANFLAADALSNPPPHAAEPRDVADEAGGGATRNAVPCYDLPHHRIVHHALIHVPIRTSTLRGLGAHLNVFAIESFMDELAELASLDPVAYRLQLSSDPRLRRVIERAADMADWPGASVLGDGRAYGIGAARYKNRAAYLAAVAEVEVAEEVRVSRIWCAVDAGLVINPDGAANQIEGGIVQAVSWTLKEQLRFADGRVASRTWEDYPILRFSEVPEVDISFVGEAGEPALGVGEAAVGPTAAALGNATSRALGARIRDLPLSRERLMEVLLA